MQDKAISQSRYCLTSKPNCGILILYAFAACVNSYSHVFLLLENVTVKCLFKLSYYEVYDSFTFRSTYDFCNVNASVAAFCYSLFKGAFVFLCSMHDRFHSVTAACMEAMERNGSSEEEVDVNNGFIDPQAEDRELKGQLLRKYSGYLGSLKQEFMKKRKKGKLPKEARQQLLDWWSRHYKWPYPSVRPSSYNLVSVPKSYLTSF